MAQELSENNSDHGTSDGEERLSGQEKKYCEADDRSATPSSEQSCDDCCKNNNLSFGIDNILNSNTSLNGKNDYSDTKTDKQNKNELKENSSHLFDFLSCPRLVRGDGEPREEEENGRTSPQESYLSLANHLAMWTYRDVSKDRFPGASVRRIGHPYQNRTPPKRKKPRTSFTRLQIMELERRFEQQKYLASSERSTIAKSLKMSDSQVKTWFQNRRTKWRRQTAEEKELERQAANRLLLSIGRCAGKSMVSMV